MKVTIPTQEFDDRLRRAINAHCGKPGLASREECRLWFVMNGTSVDDDALMELESQEEEEPDHD